MNTKCGFIIWAGLLLTIVVGCAPAPGVTPAPTSGGTVSTTGSTGAKGGTAIESVPAELKHDGYAYNGFDRSTPLTYLFARIEGDKPEEGTQTSELTSVEKGQAAFSVKRTGSLMAIGNEELLVKADGVYLVSTSLGSPEQPVKLMPSEVKPGTVWNYDYELNTTTGSKTGTSKMRFKGTARAEKEEKIKVAAGEFDTIQVTETAQMDNAGVKGTVSSKSWYAKGVGVVKMKMEVKDNKGRIVTSTIELSGTGGK